MASSEVSSHHLDPDPGIFSQYTTQHGCSEVDYLGLALDEQILFTQGDPSKVTRPLAPHTQSKDAFTSLQKKIQYKQEEQKKIACRKQPQRGNH